MLCIRLSKSNGRPAGRAEERCSARDRPRAQDLAARHGPDREARGARTGLEGAHLTSCAARLTLITWLVSAREIIRSFVAKWRVAAPRLAESHRRTARRGAERKDVRSGERRLEPKQRVTAGVVTRATSGPLEPSRYEDRAAPFQALLSLRSPALSLPSTCAELKYTSTVPRTCAQCRMSSRLESFACRQSCASSKVLYSTLDISFPSSAHPWYRTSRVCTVCLKSIRGAIPQAPGCLGTGTTHNRGVIVRLHHN